MPSLASSQAAPPGGRFCLKGKFPFSLCAPSYIIPAGILENLRYLNDKVDEVEIVLFEGKDFSNLPSPREIKQFADIGAESGLRFNVHLPLDIDVSSTGAISRIIDLTRPLNPTTWTLHVEKSADPGWKEKVHDSLSRLPAPHHAISIENLNYDLREISGIISSLGYSVCLDIGHAWMVGEDVPGLYNFFKNNIIAIHLHGVSEGKDHLPLSAVNPEEFIKTGKLITQSFRGSLSIEVFSEEHLLQSENILSWLN